MAEQKQETPRRLWVQLFNNFVSAYEQDPREVHDNGKPVHVYVPESELARVRRETWDAAIQIVRATWGVTEWGGSAPEMIKALERARDKIKLATITQG